jgi:hypothetical protein
MKKSLIISLCVAAVVSGQTQTPGFPGALGFGANATGGRNGSVYHVTTLSDSGTGSFRDAVSAPNRIIVFDVGGTITLGSPVSCSSSLTIAGQTAPGGVAIIGHEVSFSVKSNCIVRYLRVRPGSLAGSTEDAINMGDATNMIFDHVSVEFAPYNNIDAHGNYTDGNQITMQNSILADPIGQQFNAHTESLYHTFSWIDNIFSSGHDRNPLAKVNTVFINNVVNNFQAGYTVANTSGVFSHDIINNYFIVGPATTSAGNDFFQFDANQSVYASGNLENIAVNGSLSGISSAPSGVTVLNSRWSTVTASIPALPTYTAYRYDVSSAGALPHDQVDGNVLKDVTSLGTAGEGPGLWTSQTATGLGNDGYGILTPGTAPADSDGDGIPDYWKAAIGLPLNVNEAMTISSDGYANIEHYLNWLAAPNALTLTNTIVNVDLTQFTAGFTNASPVYAVYTGSNGVVALSGGHLAQFTPETNFAGLGSFRFSVLANDGSALTNTVTVCVSPLTTGQAAPVVPADNVFVALRTTYTGPSTTSIAPPPGGRYSAAAPVSGTIWNTVDLKNLVGTNSTAGSSSNLYVNLALENASGASIPPTLSITYSNVITTGTRTAPSGVNGENTLQPGGVMENAWRNYLNASGNYFTFRISGLSNSSPYDLYLEGATAVSSEGGGVQLAPANIFGTEPANAVTANTTTNSLGSYGSLWTVTGGATNLMPQGTTWTLLHGQTDASGKFSFYFNGGGSAAYLNGFQLVPVPPLIGNGAGTAAFPQGISLGQDGNARFSISGTTGAGYRIWATTNVTLEPVTNTWRLLTNGVFPGGTNLFEDSESTNFTQRFYIITLP